MWTRRVSVFEPRSGSAEAQAESADASAEAVSWVLQHDPIATIVPSINAIWEAEANLAAVARCVGAARVPADGRAATASGSLGAERQGRLWQESELAELARGADAAVVRERCDDGEILISRLPVLRNSINMAANGSILSNGKCVYAPSLTTFSGL
jgi:hypothetical protein